MKRSTAITIAAGCSLPVLFGSVLIGLISVLFSSAAQATACDTGLSSAIDTGGPVRLPVTGFFTVTSEYGMRVNPVSGIDRLHAGIDLAERPSPGPIVAMKDGTVTSTPTDVEGGNIVIIDHGGGLESRYMHLATRLVQPGQAVHEGQRIGTEGATGEVTGPHVHWEVHVNGQPVNPRVWAAAQGLSLPPLGGAGSAPGVSLGDLGSLRNAGVPTFQPGAQPSPAASSSSAGAGPAQLPDRVGNYQGEQVRNAAAIIQAGQAMQLDAWTITVGVMTAMGETSLINVDHGDAAGPDSRGLFQQRSGWGPEADRMNPPTAATKFFTALLQVPGYHDLAPTIAAHRTQHNADPYYYEPFWAAAAQMVAVITGRPGVLSSLPASGGTVTCDPVIATASIPAEPTSSCPATTSPAETGLRPAALEALRCVHQAFPQIHTMYGLGTRPGPSDHTTGDAVDFMIDNYRTPQGRAMGWQLAKWVRANAADLHVTYVIFDMQIWSVERDDEGWRPYTRYGNTTDDTLAHRDHVHVSTTSDDVS